MKIRFLLLPFILAGIIISGSIYAQSEPFSHKNQGNLHETSFSPYGEFLNHGVSANHNISNTYHRFPLYPFHSFFRKHPSTPYNMKNATYLLDRNIEKEERISEQLEIRIQKYKAEGKDVSRLEASLEKHNILIKEAKEYRALANSSTDSERQYLIESQKKMIQASHALKDIFREFRPLMPGSEELNNTSHLNATGEGRAFLKGSFTLNLHMEKGEMAIPYLSPDSEVDIKGDYTFEKKNKMQGEMYLYHIQSADVKISGSEKTVMLKGANISLTADGGGDATFVGNGTYRVENTGGIVKEQNWEPPFFEESMHPDEFRPPHDNINSSELKPGEGMNPDKLELSNDETNPDKMNPFKRDMNYD